MAFDEEGQATTVEHRVSICERAYRLLDRRGRLRARGHRLRPERPRRRDRDRGAQRLRPRVHRGAAADQGALPGRAHVGRHLEPQLLVPRQRRPARGDALGVPLPRDPRRPRHGHRQRRPARGLRGSRPGAEGAGRGRHLQPPRPTRPTGWSRSPSASAARERAASSTSPGARRRSASGIEHALVHGIVDFVEDDSEEARARVGPAARRDRGAADGRHARRRRPVRVGPDVPAAGREVGAGDEARRRLPGAVHGRRARGRAAAARARCCWPR